MFLSVLTGSIAMGSVLALISFLAFLIYIFRQHRAAGFDSNKSRPHSGFEKSRIEYALRWLSGEIYGIDYEVTRAGAESPPNFGSMQVKGVRDVWEDGEREELRGMT